MKKAGTAAQALHLEQIPNIGRSLAENLRELGIQSPGQLKNKDGIELYHTLNRLTGKRHDPCVADTFMAAVDFMKGGAPKPWWAFTSERKRLFRGEKTVSAGTVRGKSSR